MRRRVLWSEVQYEFFGLEAFVLDDGKLDTGAFADLSEFGVGGGQR